MASFIGPADAVFALTADVTAVLLVGPPRSFAAEVALPLTLATATRGDGATDAFLRLLKSVKSILNISSSFRPGFFAFDFRGMGAAAGTEVPVGATCTDGVRKDVGADSRIGAEIFNVVDETVVGYEAGGVGVTGNGWGRWVVSVSEDNVD